MKNVDAINLIPKSWEFTSIGSITAAVETRNPADSPDEEFFYIDISSIDNSVNLITEPKVYNGSDAPSRARQIVFEEDIVFSTVRTYLKNIAMVPGEYHQQIASTGFSVLRARRGVESRYLFYFVLSTDFLEELGNLQRGVSYPAVRDRDIRSQTLPLAPLPEQRRIVDAIETHFSRIDTAVAALERIQANLRRYRASVLKAACEGRLVPTEAELAQAEGRDYEPATVLLDRILSERRRRWEEIEWAKHVEKAKRKVAQARRKAASRPARLSDLSEAEWQEVPEAEYARYLPKNDRWKGKYEEPTGPDVKGLAESPEGWVWGAAEQISAFITKGTTPKAIKMSRDAGDIPFIKVYNLTFGGVLA